MYCPYKFNESTIDSLGVSMPGKRAECEREKSAPVDSDSPPQLMAAPAIAASAREISKPIRLNRELDEDLRSYE